MINALMPGEHDWMNGPVASSSGGPWTPSPSVPSMTPQSARGANVPGKKPNPLMNALGVAATTLFSNDPAASFQRKKDMQLGNALAMNDYEGAAQMALNQGKLDQGMKMRDLGTAYTEQQKATEAETRQKEAQQVYQLFSNMQPLQINEFAMADPAGFEQATGMSSEEYLQSAQRMMQVGMSPEQFHQYVIQQAQAELGMGGSVEGKEVNNRLVNPVTGEVIGDYSDPRAPIEVNGVLVDPTTFEPVADYRTPTQMGAMTEYQLADLDLRRNKLEAAGASGAAGTRYLSPAELAAAGYPEGSVVQVDENGKDLVRYKPSSEYSAGEIKAFRDKDAVLADFERNLQAYRAAVEADGTVDLYSRSNKKAAKLDALHQALIFGAKDLLNLGILSKDDYENLNKLIPDATGMGTWGQSKDAFLSKLSPLEATIQSQRSFIPEQYRAQQSGSQTTKVPETFGPQPGDIEDGYEFVGGDPGDPNNWRPASGVKVRF